MCWFCLNYTMEVKMETPPHQSPLGAVWFQWRALIGFRQSVQGKQPLPWSLSDDESRNLQEKLRWNGSYRGVRPFLSRPLLVPLEVTDFIKEEGVS